MEPSEKGAGTLCPSESLGLSVILCAQLQALFEVNLKVGQIINLTLPDYNPQIYIIVFGHLDKLETDFATIPALDHSQSQENIFDHPCWKTKCKHPTLKKLKSFKIKELCRVKDTFSYFSREFYFSFCPGQAEEPHNF